MPYVHAFDTDHVDDRPISRSGRWAIAISLAVAAGFLWLLTHVIAGVLYLAAERLR